MVLTETQKIKNREYSRKYYGCEINKQKQSEYMRTYHKNNQILLKEYKNMLKKNNDKNDVI